MTLAFRPREGAPELSTPKPAEVTYLESLKEKHSFDVHRLGDRGLGVLYFASHEPTQDTPLVLVPGFSAPRAVYHALAAKLADTGINTAIYRPQRQQSLGAVLSPSHMRDVLRLQQQTVKEVMEAVRTETHATEFALAGHSMGMSIATGVAHHLQVEHPHKDLTVTTLISDAGAGLDEPAVRPGQGRTSRALGAIGRHAERLPNVILRELTQVPRVLEVAPTNMKYDALAHLRDLGRLAREGFQVMVYPEVHGRLEQLRAETPIRVGALLPEKDQFFYPDDVEARSGHLLDVMTRIPDAYHVHANTHPDEHAEYMTAMIAQLQHKQEPTQHKAPA